MTATLRLRHLAAGSSVNANGQVVVVAVLQPFDKMVDRTAGIDSA